MKAIFLIIPLLLMAFNVQGQKADKETIVIKTAISCDHCLQCNSCGENLQEHIRENQGIKKVKIDPAANTITITYNTLRTTPEKIRAAINAAGYDADDLKATTETVNKLDGCCRKR